MSGSFPAISDGTVVEYPFTRELILPVTIQKFGNFTEQRYVSASPTNNMSFPRQHLYYLDRAAIDTFFIAQKGRFDATWDITIDGVVYSNMAFDQDSLQWQEEANYPTFFNCQLKLAQQQPPIFATMAALTVSSPNWLNLSTTAVTQLPSSITNNFSTDLASPPMLTAARNSWAKLTTPQRSWNLSFQNITDAERDAFEAFFIQMRGSWGVFAFHWEFITGAVPCRFDTQSLLIEYVDVNQNAIRDIPIREVL